jgi:small subunit ribosomal protein S13
VIRLLGVNLKKTKQILYALTSIYGIGLSTSKNILDNINIDFERRVESLTIEETIALRKNLENNSLKFEGDLKRVIGLHLKRLNDINCNRGRRHRNKLPVRGQRTKTNARTRRELKQTRRSKKK